MRPAPWQWPLFFCVLAACGPTRPEREGPLPDAQLPEAVRPYLALVGSWIDTTTDDHMDFHETWTHAGGAGLIGHGFILTKGDTVFIEELALGWKDNGEATYSARITSPNKGRWVPFHGRAMGTDTLVFINARRDFPKRIAYIRSGAGWSVRVTGVEKGERRIEVFELRPTSSRDM